MTELELTVNGKPRIVAAGPDRTLLEVLRDELVLTGTKRGCDIGACGACTVIIDGVAVLSCMTLAVRCRGRKIITIEGLGRADRLHPLQESAIAHGAVQCGYCTPGWLLSAKALLDENPDPTREDVARAIAGNLCRCTGYQKIIESILAVGGPESRTTA